MCVKVVQSSNQHTQSRKYFEFFFYSRPNHIFGNLSPFPTQHRDGLVHLADQTVDEVLTVASITTLNEVLGDGLETTTRGGQLEGPQEVVCLLEVRANSVDLMNEIFDANNVVLAEGFLDDLVVEQRNTLTIDLSKSTLVNKLTNTLQVRITIRDVRLNKAKHADGGRVQLDEHTVVNLAKAKELKDLLDARADCVDTASVQKKKFRVGSNQWWKF
jgi:hypothetical protein